MDDSHRQTRVRELQTVSESSKLELKAGLQMLSVALEFNLSIPSQNLKRPPVSDSANDGTSIHRAKDAQHIMPSCPSLSFVNGKT
jgi:hypothetical protein